MTRAIVNTWDQMVAAGGDQVAIGYHSPASRNVRPAAYYVWRLVDGKQVPTDPKAAWYENGCRHFLPDHPLRVGKPQALAAAMAWADATFGKRDWVRNRMGDYLARDVNERFPIPPRPRRPPI